MFDFVSYVRDTGLEVRVLPPDAGVFISLEVRDSKSCFCERYQITDREVRGCGNVDVYTRQVLDMMAAKIGSKTARLYANRLGDRQRQEREDFFREA